MPKTIGLLELGWNPDLSSVVSRLGFAFEEVRWQKVFSTFLMLENKCKGRLRIISQGSCPSGNGVMDKVLAC